MPVKTPTHQVVRRNTGKWSFQGSFSECEEYLRLFKHTEETHFIRPYQAEKKPSKSKQRP